MYDSSDDDECAKPERVACAEEYAQLCTKGGIARCGKWWRACSLKQAECALGHYGLRARGAAPLAKSLATNTCIKRLDLSDNGLGSEGIISVLQALANNGAPALRVLMLGRNAAGVEGAEAVAELLRASPAHPLERLDLTANAIGDRGVKAIAEALGENTSLDSLMLDDNEIDTEGAEYLSAALQANRRLAELSLEWNQIRADGGRAIADALRGQASLRGLNLGWNGLGDDGVAAVAGALGAAAASADSDGDAEKPTCALTDLRLHHNRLSADGGVALAHIISGLRSLDVSGNPLGGGGAAALLLALQGGEPPCRLLANDICVRPETKLEGLLACAARGEPMEMEALAAAGVDALAASVLSSGSAAIEQSKKKPAKKKAGEKAAAKGAEPKSKPPPKAKTDAKPAGVLSRRNSINDNGPSEATDWRRTDRRPDEVERKGAPMRE